MKLPKIWKSLFLAFGLLFFILLAPAKSYAIAPGSLQDFQSAVAQQGYNKESFDVQSSVGLFNTINTALIGCILPKEECGKLGQAGVLQMLGGGIVALYSSPPVSGVQYFADIGRKLNLVEPAYAQGPTFQTLSNTILPAWRGFRNVAYGFFVIIFIMISFAIMFRARLDPQTVVTIQSALPRAITALLLITFSYAIVGLLVDFTFVITALYETVRQKVLPTPSDPELLTLIKQILSPVAVGEALGKMIGNMINIPILGVIGGIVAGAVGGVANALVTLIMVILLLFAFLRIGLIMAMAFIGIILKTVFAPLIILFNTLPGRPLLWGWLAGVLADISVFPTFYVLMGVALWLLANLPPVFLPISGAGIFGFLSIFVTNLIGIGIMLYLPNIVNVVKETIQRSVPLGGPAGVGLIRAGIGPGYEYYLEKTPVEALPRWLQSGKLTRSLADFFVGAIRK